MKRIILITYLFMTFLFCQDRSIIFSTGSPDSTLGYLIDINNSVANKFSIANDNVLEAMILFISSENIEESNIKISLREDNNGTPGNLVSELSQWDYQIDILHPFNYNLITTTDLCIYLDAGNFYWWVVEAGDEFTQATWIYSNSPFYNIATSQDSGSNWNSETTYAGAGVIYGEQIFEVEVSSGDINSDFTTNVVDIVGLVSYVLGDSSLSSEQLVIADINRDGLINVVDIVALVNIVLEPPQQISDFTLEDINPSSEYYGLDIGPSFFSGQVSCYYFGKQG